MRVGQKVSWFACGGQWFGHVKFEYKEFVFVTADKSQDTQVFRKDDQNLKAV